MPPERRVPGRFDLSVIYRTNVAMSSKRITLPHFWQDAGEADGDGFYLLATDPLRDPKGSEVEHWYVSWTPVDAAHVAHWLDRPVFAAELINPEEAPRWKPGTLWFTSDRLASPVEQNVDNGSLGAALEREVATFRAALDCRETEWRTAARASTAALIGELRKDISGHEGKDL